MNSPAWGIVSTIRAPARDVLNFAAWHLDLGATRLMLHFDDPDAPVPEALRNHPQIDVVVADQAYWQRIGRRRPTRHQPRQTLNATRAYAANTACDWLAHIDVDEFLLCDGPVAGHLARLAPECQTARLRPIEALAADALPTEPPDTRVNFKAFTLQTPLRHRQTARIFPTYGGWLNGGMLSHAAGKLFVRKGLPEAEFRIHNVLSRGEQNPGQVELSDISLAHFHAGPWEDWLKHYRFRLESGAYRAGLRPAQGATAPLHDLLRDLENRRGLAGLRHFHQEVCCDTPDLRARLGAEGLLRTAEFDFATLRRRHFADATT
ncbi:glycosyltransferase family 2 protein [Pseudooceanicola sediminis]|uniref:Glycosyltransferase family 2 protein n=1 Tax=Pseudooceanicola sediminis TaxID=2211117 RepID=A0A399J541_9RHOB|nr:glycosyltransferase family 2 protein [Pseudooceanicola sediminis]KAA2316157.1 glycosyltransferase family 2 protein [Puniceibacterium sp. HSS470]RII39072.1 glycosyltransferase family 2 protein [Pseudooceanicola sediminis]|tara:strand:- start:112988 stop:113947 length:960 start_codon:yes stop_codon:yes gene_type:complete